MDVKELNQLEQKFLAAIVSIFDSVTELWIAFLLLDSPSSFKAQPPLSPKNSWEEGEWLSIIKTVKVEEVFFLSLLYIKYKWLLSEWMINPLPVYKSET